MYGLIRGQAHTTERRYAISRKGTKAVTRHNRAESEGESVKRGCRRGGIGGVNCKLLKKEISYGLTLGSR